VRDHLAHELNAFRLVVLLGAVSLFMDMAGDGYCSLVGPYLRTMGATASIVAIIVGVGGLVAYRAHHGRPGATGPQGPLHGHCRPDRPGTAGPHPMELEECPRVKNRVKSKFPRLFGPYLLAAGLLAAAFVDFPLIPYHMSAADHLPDFCIPMLFATAMGMDALSALIFGRFYDRVR
jgi:hypothetical protein